MVGEALNAMPHLLAVITVQVVLHSPPIVRFSLSDASLQVLSGCTVELSVAGYLCGVHLPQLLNLPGQPGLLTGVDPDASVHFDSVYAVLDIAQYIDHL